MDYFLILFQFFNLICKHNLIVIDSSNHYITMIMAKIRTLGKHLMLMQRRWVTHTLLMGRILAPATRETVWQLSTKLNKQRACNPAGQFSQRMEDFSSPKTLCRSIHLVLYGIARMWNCQQEAYNRLYRLALLSNEREQTLDTHCTLGESPGNCAD